MVNALYKWPEAGEVGRRIPKERFYKQGTVPPALKRMFISEVKQIRWAYKLAELTTNLEADHSVPEIQVFELEARADDLDTRVLRAIDTAIPYPIFFEITRASETSEEVKFAAAQKTLGKGSPKVGQYLSTKWMPSETARRDLPTALSLSSLYQLLLTDLAEIAPRHDQNLSELADRLENIGRLERDIASLKRKMRSEKQFNRKVELLRQLKSKEEQIEQLR